jgi:hypothetical protein
MAIEACFLLSLAAFIDFFLSISFGYRQFDIQFSDIAAASWSMIFAFLQFRFHFAGFLFRRFQAFHYTADFFAFFRATVSRFHIDVSMDYRFHFYFSPMIAFLSY